MTILDTANKNLEKRKNLKQQIDENKEKIRKYKAKIKEHLDYKETIKKNIPCQIFKNRNEIFQSIK